METVCNALFGRYLDKFLSFVEHNIKIFMLCHAEFISMKENLVGIQKLLEDVENANHGMKSLGHVTNQLRELMYEAEDRIADYSHLSTFNRLGIGTKLEDINGKLKEMKSELQNSVNAGGGKRKSEDVFKHRKPDPVNDVNKIVGVGDAVTKIRKWVLNEDNVKYNRIGLVGKGGSGKTTLAQMILKDKDIKEYFGLKMMFVTVSQPVDVKMMMKSMLKQLKVQTTDDDDQREMSEKIYEHLEGSRYFVILDDVWNLDDNWWNTIENALPEGSEKNCILITSRNRDIVEKDMGVSEERIHKPGELKDEDGLSLFCISAKIDAFEDTKMKKIGLEIVQKCCGLPLAIKIMGGVVLSNEFSPPKWIEIRDSFKQHISNNKNDSVMGSLGLSYDDLRLTYLKPCLLSFGVFPEDYVIEKDTMIRWWIGEGFVPLTKDGRVSVESAEKCFEELVDRSLVEVVDRDYTGKVLTCKVHDLVREMLIQKGKSEAFFEIGKDKISRRIVLNGEDIITAKNQISASEIIVRAIISIDRSGHVFTKEFLDKTFNDCEYLRVLDMSNMNSKFWDKRMFESIGNLKHLTYLYVSKDPFLFPKSLLVLCLSITDIQTLPDSITELKQLIWLDVSGCFDLNYLPKELGNVSTLQVLKGFTPSVEGCRFEELRKLTQLVTLEINLTYHGEFADSELDSLSELNALRRLTIECKLKRKLFLQMMYNLFYQKLDKLVLPKLLEELRLVGYPGEETPPWLNVEHLPRLRCLSLYGGWNLKRFHENFYGSEKKWGIIHLELFHLPKLEGNWNVILERLLYLKTLHSPDHLDISLTNYPTAQQFGKTNVWRRRGEGAA